jgi:HlyD family secretion protein
MNKNNKMNKTILVAAIALVTACGKNKNEFDASGTFEAVETIVSAEATGVVKQLSISEGQVLEKGQTIGFIDSVQLYLKRKQIQAQIKAVLSRMPNAEAQLAAMREQLRQAEKEQQRISNLLKAEAATQKQLDDISTQVTVFKKQIEAQESSLGITSHGLSEETVPLNIQVEQLDDQIAKCRIVNPVKGTVLTKYTEENEMASIGKPLYKIADLSTVTLKAYLTGDQLPETKLNQKVKVFVDSENGQYKEYEGIIEWISDKAEFTPKTIQTKDERANLVYATKIRVTNDGFLKLGMYAEIKF